ncbi:MAG: NAD(+)/NADH kinase, partial [Solirubrobacterales bacterium]|nr:NAD(+)/NADH kinase [Solirubrobacterales bacterium]
MKSTATGARDRSPSLPHRRPTTPVRTATVLTHRRPAETGPALELLLEFARRAGALLLFDPVETTKHGLSRADGLELEATVRRDVDICFALGGDGTILSALRLYARTGIPVFAVNFGEVGFLATIDPSEVDDGFSRAFAGDFEVLTLPA